MKGSVLRAGSVSSIRALRKRCCNREFDLSGHKISRVTEDANLPSEPRGVHFQIPLSSNPHDVDTHFLSHRDFQDQRGVTVNCPL